MSPMPRSTIQEGKQRSIRQDGLTDLFLLRDHAAEERLERVLEVLDPLLLETRNLALDKPGHLVEIRLRVQRSSLRLEKCSHR